MMLVICTHCVVSSVNEKYDRVRGLARKLQVPFLAYLVVVILFLFFIVIVPVGAFDALLRRSRFVVVHMLLLLQPRGSSCEAEYVVLSSEIIIGKKLLKV